MRAWVLRPPPNGLAIRRLRLLQTSLFPLRVAEIGMSDRYLGRQRRQRTAKLMLRERPVSFQSAKNQQDCGKAGRMQDGTALQRGNVRERSGNPQRRARFRFTNFPNKPVVVIVQRSRGD